MAVAAHDAGMEVTCPGCDQIVLQKAMIPVVGDEAPGGGGHRVRYLCVACARALIVPPSVPLSVPEAGPGDHPSTN